MAFAVFATDLQSDPSILMSDGGAVLMTGWGWEFQASCTTPQPWNKHVVNIIIIIIFDHTI